LGGGIEREGRTYYEYKYVFGRWWKWENDKKYILYLGGDFYQVLWEMKIVGDVFISLQLIFPKNLIVHNLNTNNPLN
jgi:hypothetical protein